MQAPRRRARSLRDRVRLADGQRAADELSLRWFTPTTEVDLCGHATLATAHALRQAGRAADGDVLVFRTRSGRLTARFDGDVVELDLPATRPVLVDRPPALPAAWPVAAVAEYGGSLVVELDDAAAVRGAVVDVPAIAALAYRVVVVTARGPAPADRRPDRHRRHRRPDRHRRPTTSFASSARTSASTRTR